MWILLLASGCLVRVDGGAVASFDPGEPARPTGQLNLGVGFGRGPGQVTVNLQSEVSERGGDVVVTPEGCLRHQPGLVGVGGCLGVALIGGGTYQGAPSLRAVSPYGDLHATAQLFESNSWWVLLRTGARGGVDVRPIGPSPSPFVGGYLGLEFWFVPNFVD